MVGSSYKRVPQDETEEPENTSPIWQHIWRGVNAVMVVFFILAAYVQVNDPDPYIWVPIYLIPALLSLVICIYPQSSSSRIWQVCAVVHFAICLSGCVYLAVVVIQLLVEKGAGNPLVHEEGRELGGLIVICIWLVIVKFTAVGSLGSGKTLLLVTIVLSLCPLAFWGLCFVENLQHLGHCTEMFGPGSMMDREL